MSDNDKPHPFTPRELRRLATYRAAIVARFFTDDVKPEQAARCTGYCALHPLNNGMFCGSCGRHLAA